MSKNYYNKILGKKIIYNTPIFIVDVELDEIIKGSINGGNDNQRVTFNYQSLLKDDEQRVRFMYALHYNTDNSSSILRKIFLTKNIDINVLSKYKTTLIKEDPLDDIAYNILLDTEHKCDIVKLSSIVDIDSYVDKLYQKIKKHDCIIYKTHDISQLNSTNDFLIKWYHFINELNGLDEFNSLNIRELTDDINIFKKAGFTVNGTYTPRDDPYNNPLYVSYIKLIK
jgi:hypothetical protein